MVFSYGIDFVEFVVVVLGRGLYDSFHTTTVCTIDRDRGYPGLLPVAWVRRCVCICVCWCVGVCVCARVCVCVVCVLQGSRLTERA